MDDDLTLHEPALVESVADDGSVLIHLIRPCVGRGRGRHLYEADMLQANAHKFVGWKMFVDHRDPAAQRAAGGLPRSIRDLGGRIIESWWDPDVPAEGRFGAGAVVGRAKPTPFIRDLVTNDPELVETSINTVATGTKPVTRDGVRVNLVEGISDRGSVDWVTEAGAGGKVVAMMEAAQAEGHDDLIEDMTDEEFIAYVAETRPGLVVEAKKGSAADDAEDAADGGADEDTEDALVNKFKKKGLPHALAVKAAKRQKAGSVKESAHEEDEMPEITPEVLAEALQTPEVADMFRPLIESVIAEERDLIRAEARADADRQIELRDLRDLARHQISEAQLPPALASQIATEFELVEGHPTPWLDCVAEYDDEGNQTRSAAEVLAEAVAASIGRGRELMGQINPTKVRDMPGSSDKPAGEKPKASESMPHTAALMEGAGFDAETVNSLWS